ncbi:hypothetical protein E4T56_gene12322 [Termitomyces sp. T112]|nr:hypothetical protein E4T56_gene12322 [Termitomyces sp. T112]
MTPEPLHYAADAPPATSPPSPSPAATLEADTWTSVPTCLGSMQMLWSFSNRQRIGKDTYEGSPRTPKWPHWPANPPSTLLPPILPAANHPLAPFPAPLPPLWATPPAVSDTPTSPIPLALTPVPLALRCSMPAPTPPSLPALHLDSPSPIKAPPPMPSMLPLEPPPACKERPL